MSRRSLIVDGFDLSTLGFILEVPDHREGQQAEWSLQEVPGRFGSVVTGSSPRYPARTMNLTGTVIADDLSHATLRSNLDEIKWRLGRSERVFRFSDDETLDFNARCVLASFPHIPPGLIQTAVKMRVRLLMVDPRKFATSDTVVGSIGASPTDLPLGTAPSDASISVTGSGSFTLTYKHEDGTTLYTMTITGATAPVTIDMSAYTITDAGGNAAEYLTGGGFFAFDPEDGDDIFGTPDWPTLEVSSGTATATYKKAYF